jgi:hypothetical protein
MDRSGCELSQGSYVRLWFFASPLQIDGVERAGIEPATSGLQSRRSPS